MMELPEAGMPSATCATPGRYRRTLNSRPAGLNGGGLREEVVRMNTCRSSLVIGSMMLAAFLGGAVGQWLLAGRAACAQQEAPAAPQAVRTQAVIIVDAEGNEQATLGWRPEGVGLTIRGPEGKEQVSLAVSPAGGAGLSLSDKEGRLRIGLGHDAEGGGLFLLDENGVSRVDVGLAPSGNEGGFALNNAEGKIRAGIGMGPQGVGVSLRDDEGNERLGMGLGEGGGGDFVARDQSGNEIWRALGAVAPEPLP